MSKSLLITRPRYDLITSYFYAWSEAIIKFSRSKTIPTYDLKQNKATKTDFDSYLAAHQPSLVFMNAHGNPNQILGQNSQLLLSNSNTIKFGILYARSCDAAQTLGKALVKYGTITFIGYTRKFILGYKTNCIGTPLKDDIAKLFLEPSNSIAITLLKGHTAQVAHNRALNKMYKNYRKMVSSTATYEERYAARWLWSNFKCQKLIGDGQQTM